MMIELGLDTFGDVMHDGDGRPVTQAQALRNVVAEGVLAEQVGVDAFGVGEHHRADFAVSAPEVVLAAIAGKTERILLGSAVTVLSTDDPIRVFQRFSTLNAVSNGRAEVILGRGSFTESYPLFGYDLSKYNELFEEKLAALRQAARPAAHRLSAGRKRPPANVGGRRRQPRVGRARGAARPAADACHHRRQREAVPAVCGAVQPRVEGVRKIAAADRRSTRLGMLPRQMSRRERKSGRTIWP